MNDPYEILQLEPLFDLDSSLLEQRHRELSRALHPDRYSGRSASERRQALGRAIEVNEAVRRLRDPVARAEALFVRLGLPVGEGTEPPADPELLMTMMERREQLRDLGRAGDTARIESLCAEVKVDRDRTMGVLSDGFRQAFTGSAAGDDDGSIGRLRGCFGELRYYRRFFDEAEAILDEIG